MDRLIYTAFSGLVGSMVQQQVIANNMANAQTTGFREELQSATPATLKGAGLEARSMSEDEVRGASMKQGTIKNTGNPLDIALTGRTMMAIQASDGTEAYTRRGDLAIDASGTLINGDGKPVLSANGPITVAPGSKVAIAPDGSVMVSDPANPNAPAEAVAKIKLVSTDGTRIAKATDGQFRVVNGGVLPADDDAKVVTSSLEESNVDATSVLVQMVQAQRLFEMRSKVITSAKENDEKSAGLMQISA